MVGYDPTAKSVTLPPSSATSPSIHASTTTSSKSSSSDSSSDSPGERPHPHQRHFVVAGFSSGCMTRFLCHPLDVLKIRFQLQIEPISRASSVSKYRTVSQTFSCIVREESMAALWKGHVSAQILSGIYGCAYFSSFELFTQLTWNLLLSSSSENSNSSTTSSLTTNHWTPATVHFFCGSLSGFSATALSHPFDVIRTRIISQSETPKTYLNTRHAMRTILAREGVAGLYRGFLPSTLQIMPFSGAQFAAYNLLKRLWHEHLGDDALLLEVPLTAGALHFHFQSSFLCGAGSGMVAKFLVYPLDLIRKRLQIRGFEAARGSAFGSVPVYQGFLHCIATTLEKESVTAFYKGLVPSLFKATLTTALNFWLYESVLAMMLNREMIQ